jgi:hypothetical protein
MRSTRVLWAALAVLLFGALAPGCIFGGEDDSVGRFCASPKEARLRDRGARTRERIRGVAAPKKWRYEEEHADGGADRGRTRRRSPMKRFLAAMMLVGMAAMVGAGGGCTPDGPEAEMDRCGRKGVACQNSCYKAEAGAACFACCADNTSACRADAGYSFFSCPDKE